MRLKPGVQLNGLQWPMWYAAAVVDYLHQSNGWGEATITSGLDEGDAWGPPRVANTEHNRGTALDIRSHTVPAELRPAFAAQLQQVLGPFFRVVLEVDHIHLELGQPVMV